MTSLAVGAGADFGVSLAGRFITWMPPRKRVLVHQFALLPFLVLPATTIVRDFGERDMSEATAAHEYANKLLAEIPHRAVFIKWNEVAEWKHFAVLLYLQRAIKTRKDITVLTRPSDERLAKLFDERRPVLAFVPTPRIRKKFRVTSDGIVHTLAPRKRKAATVARAR